MALHEADWRAHVCDPPLPEWDRLMVTLEAYATRNSIDLFVGRRLPAYWRPPASTTFG